MTRSTAHGAPQSGDRPRASTVGRGSLTGAELLEAVRRQLRIENCACGGTIAATDGDWKDIQQAVDRHAASERHQGWRKGALS